LTYAIAKKNNHISRINIPDNYKIGINSPKLHLGIKRYNAEVGHKNVIIFIYKMENITLDRLFRNGKRFL
jgi:hypothetical protein